MKVFVVLAVAIAAAVPAHASEVTPVQKVVQLLQGMLEKGKQDKHEENVQFATFKQFCEDTISSKTGIIVKLNGEIDMLDSEIVKLQVEAERLAGEIFDHDADIHAWTGDKKAATAVRAIVKAEFEKNHKDFSESIDALQRAEAHLKKQAHNRKQQGEAYRSPEEPEDQEEEAKEESAQLFVQLLAQPRIPAESKAAMRAFSSFLGVSAPEANAYEFQSSNIVDMLAKLGDKFLAQRTDLEKQEATAKAAFEMLEQHLTSSIKNSEILMSDAEKDKARALQRKADDEGALFDTTGTRDEDVKYKADLTATCENKATDFQNRQTLRAEELVALGKAIEIISGGSVSGAADEHLPTLLQGSALAQLRSSHHTQADAAEYLQKQAKKFGSSVLAALALRVGNQEANPFKSVLKLINDLITRLMEEAYEETEHKGWCDTELSTNEATRKEKTADVEMLHAVIDELETSTVKLGEDLQDLTQTVAEMQAAVEKATAIRFEEKAKNAKTNKDAQEAQTAVAQAINVLQEFYAKAGEATALLQKDQPVMPEIFDSPYKGMQAENGGVVGMLEVIQQDFARLEAETTATEEASQKEYDDFIQESKVSEAQNNKDIEHKTAKRQKQEGSLIARKAEEEGTQKELTAAQAYFDKLKPSCIQTGLTYEDRVQRRQEEIESLREALRILNIEG